MSPNFADGPLFPERRFDAAIAEFNALRAEIVGSRALQKNIVSVALAAYGVLFSVALGKGGDERVLLVIPPLGLVLCIVQLAESFQIHKIGNYIRETLWPAVIKMTGYGSSWEERHHYGNNRILLAGSAVFSDGMFPVLLFGGGLAALKMAGHLSAVEKRAEGVTLALTLVVPVVYGLAYVFVTRRKPKSGG